jgi:hypothetical protein
LASPIQEYKSDCNKREAVGCDYSQCLHSVSWRFTCFFFWPNGRRRASISFMEARTKCSPHSYLYEIGKTENDDTQLENSSKFWIRLSIRAYRMNLEQHYFDGMYDDEHNELVQLDEF